MTTQELAIELGVPMDTVRAFIRVGTAGITMRRGRGGGIEVTPEQLVELKAAVAALPPRAGRRPAWAKALDLNERDRRTIEKRAEEVGLDAKTFIRDALGMAEIDAESAEKAARAPEAAPVEG